MPITRDETSCIPLGVDGAHIMSILTTPDDPGRGFPRGFAYECHVIKFIDRYVARTLINDVWRHLDLDATHLFHHHEGIDLYCMGNQID